ncbi:MAG: HAD family acid phosphatase [Candidatus Dependentiae bacterium]
MTQKCNEKKYAFYFFAIITNDILAKPANIAEVKKQVQEYYESEAFEKETDKALQKAWQQLQNIKATETSVVIIDIDETALSYYAYFNNNAI